MGSSSSQPSASHTLKSGQHYNTAAGYAYDLGTIMPTANRAFEKVKRCNTFPCNVRFFVTGAEHITVSSQLKILPDGAVAYKLNRQSAEYCSNDGTRNQWGTNEESQPILTYKNGVPHENHYTNKHTLWTISKTSPAGKFFNFCQQWGYNSCYNCFWPQWSNGYSCQYKGSYINNGVINIYNITTQNKSNSFTLTNQHVNLSYLTCINSIILLPTVVSEKLAVIRILNQPNTITILQGGVYSFTNTPSTLYILGSVVFPYSSSNLITSMMVTYGLNNPTQTTNQIKVYFENMIGVSLSSYNFIKEDCYYDAAMTSNIFALNCTMMMCQVGFLWHLIYYYVTTNLPEIMVDLNFMLVFYKCMYTNLSRKSIITTNAINKSFNDAGYTLTLPLSLDGTIRYWVSLINNTDNITYILIYKHILDVLGSTTISAVLPTGLNPFETLLLNDVTKVTIDVSSYYNILCGSTGIFNYVSNIKLNAIQNKQQGLNMSTKSIINPLPLGMPSAPSVIKNLNTPTSSDILKSQQAIAEINTQIETNSTNEIDAVKSEITNAEKMVLESTKQISNKKRQILIKLRNPIKSVQQYNTLRIRLFNINQRIQKINKKSHQLHIDITVINNDIQTASVLNTQDINTAQATKAVLLAVANVSVTKVANQQAIKLAQANEILIQNNLAKITNIITHVKSKANKVMRIAHEIKNIANNK